MGPCAGGAVYSPAITDFTVMVDQTSHMFITGPDVIKTVTGEDVGFEELGGAQTHNTKSGVAHYMGTDEQDAIDYVKALLSYLPSNNLETPPAYGEGEADLAVTDDDRWLDTCIPDSPNVPYDMKQVIEHLVTWATTALSSSRCSRCSRRTSSPASPASTACPSASSPTSRMQFAGCLDIDASEKAARFVRTCDCFNVPVLTFVDVPGFLPGTSQEWDGIIRRGAKLIYAYAEATVPKITVITRKAYGGAYDVMGSKHLGADINLAWPTGQIAVMGAQGAVNILYRKELAATAQRAATSRPSARSSSRTTRRPSPTPTSRPSAATSTPSSRPSNTRMNVTRALRALRTSARRCRPRSTGTSRCERPHDDPRGARRDPDPRLGRPDARGGRGARRRALRPRRRRPSPAPAHAASAWSDPSWRLVGPSARRGGWRASGLPR